MPLSITGYSERGMVNAMCEDIVQATGMHQLRTFLSWCRFPFQPDGVPDFSRINAARLLVEQGFSDFGDLDLLLLLDEDEQQDRRQAVLIEAKVATDTASPTRIDDQWEDFLAFLGGRTDLTSSLFVQIYRKLRLIERVANLNQPFEPHPIWGRQSLGANRVVLKAAQHLSKCRTNPWYFIVVPDDSGTVSRFFDTTLREFRADPATLPGWDVSRIGFLTWPDLHDNFRNGTGETRWPRSLLAFEWNQHQVYPLHRPNTDGIVPGTVGTWNEQQVIIVDPAKRKHRALLEAADPTFFPRSFLVPVTEFIASNDAAIELRQHQPRRGIIYCWNPPVADQVQPPDRAPVPTPPQLVKVRQSDWVTTKVIQVTQDGVERGDEFHVFSHHLEKQARTCVQDRVGLG